MKETNNMLVIESDRRTRMRNFNASARNYRKWTAMEFAHLMRAYMSDQDTVCPVCHATIFAASYDTYGLHCEHCGNLADTRHEYGVQATEITDRWDTNRRR